jgi:altronate dehydratase
MANNIDINVSQIITNGKSIKDISDLLWKKLVNVCNGEKTNTEKLGFEEDIGIWRA